MAVAERIGTPRTEGDGNGGMAGKAGSLVGEAVAAADPAGEGVAKADPAGGMAGEGVAKADPVGIEVSLVYLGPETQVLKTLRLATGQSVRAAIERSGVLDNCPEVDLAVNKVGIHGRLVKLDQLLEEGDRIEIYRPLIADPKAARQQRAEKAKA